MGWLQTIFDRLTREPRDPAAKRVPGGTRTLAGVAITPDLALQNPTAFACHRYLTQTVGVLPWHVMRSLKGGGKEVAGSHPVDWLLYKRPNPEWGALQFRETLLSWALLWGNGYAEIERDLRHDGTAIPAAFDFDGVRGLSAEVLAKLKAVRPQTIAQARRISGVTPAAVSLLLIHLRRARRRVA